MLAAPNRRSRFHTERGRLIPPSAWARLPGQLVLRVSRRTDTGPWIVPAAVAELERILTPAARIFEFGCGYSTAWLAARSAHVISLEHDDAWLAEVRARLRRAELDNCELIRAGADDFPAVIERFSDEAFDLVIVDGQDTAATTRVDCIIASASKVAPGGHLLLDDSDNRRYAAVDDILRGWAARRFSGMKRYPLVATETSIYRRPG
jgi:predicted O-methyltransferase YrrM